MKFYSFYITFLIITFMFNLLHEDQREKSSSLSLNEAIYSGFLQSQIRILATEQLFLSCKFKSMNRKSSKSKKPKSKISKIRI